MARGPGCGEAAALLDELADLKQLEGEEFRARAYRRAARSLGQVDGLLAEALADGRVAALPGVGPSILKKLKELAATGTIRRLDEARGRVPAGLLELLRVPGVGPKRAMLLHRELGVGSLADLRAACEDGRVAALKGFGERSQRDILRGLAALARDAGRLPLPQAQALADALLAELGPRARRLEAAGSLRRRRDTVGDLDLVGVDKARKAGALGRALAGRPGALPLAAGERKTSVRLAEGPQVDLRSVEPGAFGAAMLYFTGSKAHNIRLRAIALRRGWRLNEYGLFEVPEGEAAEDEGEPAGARPGPGRRLAGASEEEVYEALGLPYIPPELREDAGEVEAAAGGRLPRLLEPGDLQGDLHTHSARSDGTLAPEAWVRAAAASGLGYVGLSDHGIGLPGWGMSGPALLAHRAEVLELADRHAEGVEVLVGAEANIMEDGSLDLPAAALDGLDYVIAGVHTRLAMDAEAMTRRVAKALRDGRVDILAHPTGRKIGQRDPVALDLDAVFEAAAASGTFLELNAQPDRLDLAGEHARRALAKGCRFAVGSDAHGAPGRALLRWGADQARRGWLRKGDVLNARPAKDVRAALRRR